MKAFSPSSRRCRDGFTLLELMVVVMIIGLLSALSFPVFAKLKRLADETHTINNLNQIVKGTMTWAAEHGDKLPSPQYNGDEVDLPTYWDLNTDGEKGMWLNGVVFAAVYMEEPTTDDDGNTVAPSVGAATNLADTGKHLVGTVFESRIATVRNPQERDWYRNSFAMNANLMYDELAVLRGLSNPWYSEKNISKYDPATAMLFIDCTEKNIVMAEDLPLIEESSVDRYDGKRIIAAFVGGHVTKMDPDDIPDGDIESDREASMFWRGIMPKR